MVAFVTSFVYTRLSLFRMIYADTAAVSPTIAPTSNPAGFAFMAVFKSHCDTVAPSFAFLYAFHAAVAASTAGPTVFICRLAAAIPVIPAAIISPLSRIHVRPSIMTGSASSPVSMAFSQNSPRDFDNLSSDTLMLPLSMDFCNLPTASVAPSTASFIVSSNNSYAEIPKPSRADCNIVTFPLRLLFRVSAIFLAAPE